MATARKDKNNNQNIVHNLKKIQKESTKTIENVTDEWTKIKEDSIASIVGLVASYEENRKNASSMEYKKLDETAKDSKKIDDASKEASYELQKQNDEKDATIMALRIEIDNLKKKVTDQEETIDDLVGDRDEAYDEVYRLKLKLADAWSIKLETDAEKVREVARRIRCNEANKSYCDAVKEKDKSTVVKDDGFATDSGIDMQSLEKMVDERVAVTIDAKFEEHIKNKADAINEKPSNEITEIIYKFCTNSDEISYEIAQTTLPDDRELNIIVHGVEEDAGTQTGPVFKELFDTLEVKHHLTTLADRLGGKSPDKIRPIRVTMESLERKRELMAKLWKLKHGPEKFQKISVTEDYTQEERKEIKRWVDEAKERTKKGDGYVWKIRGSPRSKLRFVKMRVWQNSA